MNLAQSLLDRINLLEPELRAWVTIDREEVLNAAKQRESELDGGSLGPLHGVPIGLKDIFYTAGMKTSACSRIFADFVPFLQKLQKGLKSSKITFASDLHTRTVMRVILTPTSTCFEKSALFLSILCLNFLVHIYF